MQLANPHLFRQQALINNHWLDANQGTTLAVYNPADSSVVGQVPDMMQAETNQAIEAAFKAQRSWCQTTADERFQCLMKWHQLIIENRQDLGILMSIEQGKPLTEALFEVDYANSFIAWFAEQGRRILGRHMNHYAHNMELNYEYEAVGVVGVITPWNFPYAMITRKVAAAIAAGCSVVIKPSELTPFSALALAYLSTQAGFPAGLINVVTGANAAVIGKTLCEHSKVRKISFTGSTRVGKLLMQQSAQTVKKVSMELGGNAPFIVFDDADIDKAVEGLMLSKFRNAGQTCVCPNRVFVQQNRQAEFEQKLLAKVSQLKVGHGLQEGVTIGPLISSAAVDKALRHVSDSLNAGAKLLIGGSVHPLGGQFFEPTVLTQVKAGGVFCCEETFAPIVPIISFSQEDQAITQANASEYGLAAYFYSQDFRRIRRVSKALECGMIGINVGSFSNVYGPFGGVKESGVGREGSEVGIDEYLNAKYCLTSYS